MLPSATVLTTAPFDVSPADFPAPPLDALPTAFLPHVDVWTDGSCRPNPGSGGWAFILRNAEGKTFEKAGSVPDTTNSRMELQAALSAMIALSGPRRLTIHTDSEYLWRGMTTYSEQWRRNGFRTTAGKGIKNLDLWQQVFAAAESHVIEWRHVVAHSGDPMNTRAYVLAAAAAEA